MLMVLHQQQQLTGQHPCDLNRRAWVVELPFTFSQTNNILHVFSVFLCIMFLNCSPLFWVLFHEQVPE